MEKVDAFCYLGKNVNIKIDRKLGSRHPKHGFMYMLNYGFVPNTVSGDNEELDAYLIDEFEPVDEVVGKQFADQKFSRDIIQLAAVDRTYLCGALAAHKIQQGKVNFLVGGFDKGLADQLL